MKILFAGTPKTSSIILKNLIDLGHDIIGVITQPDKKRGRRAIESPSPVSEIARSNDIKQYKPTNLNDLEFKNTISNNEFDVLIVVAYGKILPKWLLDLPNIMPVNIHFSLLPKYRGASPIQSSLLNGDTETGITFIKMTEGLDAFRAVQPELPFHAFRSFDALRLTLAQSHVTQILLLIDHCAPIRFPLRQGA